MPRFALAAVPFERLAVMPDPIRQVSNGNRLLAAVEGQDFTASQECRGENPTGVDETGQGPRLGKAAASRRIGGARRGHEIHGGFRFLWDFFLQKAREDRTPFRFADCRFRPRSAAGRFDVVPCCESAGLALRVRRVLEASLDLRRRRASISKITISNKSPAMIPRKIEFVDIAYRSEGRLPKYEPSHS